MLLSFSTADAVGIRDEHVQLVRLKAGQLPEVTTVLEQQNAIELVPTAYMRGKDRIPWWFDFPSSISETRKVQSLGGWRLISRLTFRASIR